MAHVLIIEDDGYRIFMIERALAADGHRFSACSSDTHPSLLADMLAGGKVDLVIINRFLAHGNGWDLFNRLKEQETHKKKIMLYVLEDCNLGTIKWLSTFVREALLCRQKKCGIPSYWRRNIPPQMVPFRPLT